jgi:hypothetical protein
MRAAMGGSLHSPRYPTRGTAHSMERRWSHQEHASKSLWHFQEMAQQVFGNHPMFLGLNSIAVVLDDDKRRRQLQRESIPAVFPRSFTVVGQVVHLSQPSRSLSMPTKNRKISNHPQPWATPPQPTPAETALLTLAPRRRTSAKDVPACPAKQSTVSKLSQSHSLLQA